MFRKNWWSQFSIFVLLLIASIWFLNNSFAGNEELYLKTDKGLFYLKQVYETVARKYVDEVDPEHLSKSAIKGIVKELDPYTVFFEKNGSERLEIITKGKYGGLGMEISKREGKITVISPIDDTPAKRAGIRAGDVIEKIEDKSTEDMSLEEASSKLRGKVGTKVTIQIKRPGHDKSINLTLTREEIVLKDVSYADFVEPGVAYFRLTSFSDKAASELKNAIRRLKNKGNINYAILDLRGNPGGLLASAVEVANIFVQKGETVVETRGTHERNAEFVTEENAVLPNVPLAVLVDGGSASASEIVAGAVQDLDRGVILGDETFGKGLVQQVYPIDKINDAYLKMTTAKYYIPSGRSIQKDDYKENKKIFTDMSDSSEYNNHTKYYTKNGRIVHGGGGIKPDIQVEEDKIDRYITALWAQGHFFEFTVDYLANHPEIDTLNGFNVNEEILNEFKTYLKSKELEFKIEGEEKLTSFLQIAEEKEYSEDMKDLVTVALQKLQTEKKKEFDKHIVQIKETLESEFAEKLGGSTAQIAAQLKHDKTLLKAINVLESNNEYQEILAIKQ